MGYVRIYATLPWGLARGMESGVGTGRATLSSVGPKKGGGGR